MTLTIIMETSTIAFIWIVSLRIGTYAATHQYKLGDYVASFIGFIGLAIPNFCWRWSCSTSARSISACRSAA